MNDAVLTLHDYERAAQAVLSEAAWAYFSGGAADEISLRRKQSAWQSWGQRPGVLQDLRGGHTRYRLLGRERSQYISIDRLWPLETQRLAASPS
jgi:4-hydroxymandelate oxidase